MNIQCLQHDPPYTLYSIASLKIHDVSNDAVNKIDLRSESAFLVSETKVKKVSPEETVKRALVQINLREDQSFAGNSNIILITDPIHFLGLVHLPKSFSGKIVATEAAVQIGKHLLKERLQNISTEYRYDDELYLEEILEKSILTCTFGETISVGFL